MIKKQLATGHSFTCHDIFMNLKVNKLKMTPQQCKEIYSDGSKRDLAASIFLYSVRLVMQDIIDNGTQFKLPSMGRTQSYIEMQRTTGEDFKKAFKRGKWRDVDFITSNFSGYQLSFRMESKKRTQRIKPIYISSKFKDQITEYTNQGKQY